MKKIFTVLIIILCTLNISPPFASRFIGKNCMCQWVWLNPYPTANNIYCIRFINSQTGYAACEAGTVLKTTNGGLNWSVKMLNNSSNLYTVHFINSNTGMVAGEFGAAYKTTNGGTSWTKIAINDSVDFRDVRFRNANTGIMITGYNCGNFFYKPRIYKTSDGGLSWSVKQYDYCSWWLYSIAFADNNNVYVSGERSLYKSTDAGETWDTVASNNFQKMGNRSVWFANSLTGYVMSTFLSGSYVFLINKTIDGGNTWNQYNTGSQYEIRSIAFTNANTGIGVGRNTGVFRTTNGGVNWVKFSNAADSSRIYYSVTNAGANRFIYAGDGGIIYRSLNNGANFTRISKSFTDETINSVSFINNLTGIVCGNNGAIFKTINGGTSWTRQTCPNAGNILKVRLFDRDTGFAIATNGRIYKTINGGTIWNAIYFDSLANGWSTADIPDRLTILITGGYCKHAGAKTTNGGISWDTVYVDCECGPPPIPTGCTTQNFVSMASNNVYFIAGGHSDPHMSGYPYVLFGFGGGSRSFGFEGGGDNNLIGFADYADTNYGIAVGGRGRVMRTNNSFRTWTDYWYPIGGFSWINYLSLADSLNCLANIGFSQTGFNNSGIYKSINGGINWALCGVLSNSLTKIKYYNFNYAVSWGPYGGIIADKAPGIILQTNPPSGEVSVSYKLYQNYPNPFNPATNIKYQITNNKLVTLRIYDVLGKEIATLVNEKQSPGVYEVTWDASQYSSGIYFYKLTAGDFSEVKRMVFIK